MGDKNKEAHVNPGFESEGGDEVKHQNGDAKVGEVDQEKEGPERAQWDNPIEFLLSCVAMSVGLGNVWRFPFTAYENGGGAFLIPYIIVLIFIGKPLYYMELCMGQFCSLGSVKVWNMVPALRGIGYGQAIATWCVVTYYVSLMALTIFYFFASFQTRLPWSFCPENVTKCIDADTNFTTYFETNSLNESRSSSESFFVDQVLHLHPNGLDDGIFAPEWRLTLCLLLSWLILFLVLMKGVKSSGKSAYFTALFPYFVLVILLIRGVTLPGAIDGIIFFITPKWAKLLEPQVWYAAVGQSFFSLSVGFGPIITFASHNKFRHNVYRDATIISVTDTLTSLLAGFTIFSILGHLAHEMGVDNIEDVIKGGGASLAFVSYPDVLARIQWVPQLFAVLFFLMLFTLGIGSASALAGCIITIICDEFPHLKRWGVTLVICIIGFLIGLFYITPQGQYILDLVDHYGGTFIIYILAFLEVVAVNWIYGYSNFIRDIEFMLQRKTGPYWAFCWVGFIPLLLFTVFVYKLVIQKPLESGGYIFGAGANGFGLLITALAVGMVPLVFLIKLWAKKNEKTSWFDAVKVLFKPSKSWSPQDPILRKQYREFLLDRRETQLGGIDNPAVLEGVAGAQKSSEYPELSGFKSIRL